MVCLFSCLVSYPSKIGPDKSIPYIFHKYHWCDMMRMRSMRCDADPKSLNWAEVKERHAARLGGYCSLFQTNQRNCGHTIFSVCTWSTLQANAREIPVEIRVNLVTSWCLSSWIQLVIKIQTTGRYSTELGWAIVFLIRTVWSHLEMPS